MAVIINTDGPDINTVTKPITDYLSSQGVGYALSWDGKTNTGELTFYVGNIQYVFRYFNNKWVDMSKYVLSNVKQLMGLNNQ